jgi:hypothetical protein
MRLSSNSSVTGLVLLFAVAQLPLVGPVFASPPPSDASGGAGGAGTSTVGVSVGGFTPPPQGEYDPSTTAEPGLLDRPRNQAVDQTYGPTGTGEQVGYDIIDAGLYGSADDGAAMPDFHIVQEGDSLSEICDYYYGDMYLWPKIWSYNPHITNAHWIFPGDRVRLTDPYDSADGPEGGGLGYAQSYDPSQRGAQTYLLERYAFIDEEEIDKAMEVTGGAEPGIMMGTLDTAYISYKPENPPIPGERLSVYRKKTPVYDIKVKGKKQKLKQGERIGWLVEVVGEVYVRSVADKSAEAEIVDAVRPVERGQRVGELKTRFARVSPTGNEVTINGLVVETIREQTINGETQFVIINIGAADGVRRGNTLEVVQKGDAYTSDHRLHQPYEKGHPRRIFARLLVLQIEGDSALTVVTDSLREIVTGDHVELVAAGETPPDFDPYDAGARDARRSKTMEAKGSASSGGGEAEASGELTLGGN